jgi:hypothetical protein
MATDLFSAGGDTASRAIELDLIRGGESEIPDVDAAEALVESVSSLMVSVATGGPEIKRVNEEYKREHQALAAVLGRLGIAYPNRFSDLWRWYGRWSQGDMPRYQDRRAFIADLFEPVREALAHIGAATREPETGIGEGPTGWPVVDAQMTRLRKLFREADDADAFNGVGLQCVKILTSLGHVVFDAARDLPAGEEEPGIDDAKARITFFVRIVPGDGAENIRKLVNTSYAQANTAKHWHTATRIDAGVAANATALIVSTLRLLTEEDPAQTAERPQTPEIPF